LDLGSYFLAKRCINVNDIVFISGKEGTGYIIKNREMFHGVDQFLLKENQKRIVFAVLLEYEDKYLKNEQKEKEFKKRKQVKNK
jgi:hypothetical protein